MIHARGIAATETASREKTIKIFEYAMIYYNLEYRIDAVFTEARLRLEIGIWIDKLSVFAGS